MTKLILTDLISGNCLDLSLSELTELPMKDLKLHKKATTLDLSCNLLITLPRTFSTLTHIMHLDLSKNKLTQLPVDFGNLSNLQHLDLLGNLLTSLPLSFASLSRLKWLDVKGNPLENPLLIQKAGDCLSDAECQQCAISVVAYFSSINNQLQKEKQRILQERKAAEITEERKEASVGKKNKKKKDKVLASNDNAPLASDNNEKLAMLNVREIPEMVVMDESKGFCSCFVMLSFLTVTFVAVFIGICMYCEEGDGEFCQLVSSFKESSCLAVRKIFRKFALSNRVYAGSQ